MRYKVADLIKAPPGNARWVDVDDNESVGHDGFQVVSPIQGQVRLMRDPGGILVQGKISTTITWNCSRCLEPLALPIDMELSEHFRPTVAIPGGALVLADPDEEREAITEIDERHMLDLSGVIWQNLELALPATALCRPDCAGLCPQCGANQNIETCGCEPPADSRWSGLAELIRQS
ncbi:MAG: DUF177 domain-containing protein [Ardenticatenia bacterium]|nr:DUF177 domain-containing protein [Ardenticatenia bacterium]